MWRGDTNKEVSLNPNRPLSAYNVPVTIADPGPDGRVGTTDDGPSFTGYNLDAAALAAPIVNLTTHNPNLEQGDDHYTWEISGNKRMSHNFSLNSSYARTWSREAVNGVNPNAFLGTDDGQRRNYTNWQAKLAGTFLLPFQAKISPVLRHQSGDPFGRTIQARFNYGTETVLVEPESTRRVDNVTIFDIRAEKGVTIRSRRVAVFLDVFNIFNANPEQSLVQGSGATFLRPTVIVPPRVARIGAKLEW